MTQLRKSLFFRLIKEPSETEHSMGSATRYYLNVYTHFYKSKKWFPSWNWVSFFSALLGVELVWMIYRRMYFYAFLYFLFWVLLTNIGFLLIYLFGHQMPLDFKSFLFQKFTDKDVLFFSLRILAWLFKIPFILGFGVWGNALYFRFLEKESRKTHLPKSGVSSGAAGSVLLVLIGLILLNNYILQTANTTLYNKLHGYFF